MPGPQSTFPGIVGTGQVTHTRRREDWGRGKVHLPCRKREREREARHTRQVELTFLPVAHAFQAMRKRVQGGGRREGREEGGRTVQSWSHTSLTD